MFAFALNALAGLVLAVNGQTYNGGGQTVEYVVITGSDITVTDLRVRESGPGTHAVTVAGNRNTLRRVTVERAGDTGVYFLSGTGHVLEDSIIRDPARRQGIDSWGIYSSTTGTVTVRRTTVYGSGFSNYAPGGSVILEDNRFVVPEDYRTDCQGRIDRAGPCQCAEMGVALKSGNAVILGNYFEGYRTSDPVCGGSGSPGAGVFVAACADFESCPTDNVRIESNTITNSHFGIYLSKGSTNVRIYVNHICNSDFAISDGFGAPSWIQGNTFTGNVLDLNLYGSRFGRVSNNTVVTGGC
jgi:hypothetical protein